MKKLISLILCALMCFSLLTGCGDDAGSKKRSKKESTKVEESTSGKNEVLTKEEILDNAIEFWNSSETFKTVADMEINISAEGESVATQTKIESLYDIKDQEAYAKISTSQNSQSSTIETYINLDDDGYVVYLNDGSQWYKQTAISNDVANRNSIAPEKDQMMISYLENCKKNAEFEEDEDYYIFSAAIASSDIETIKTTPLKDTINTLLDMGMTEEDVTALLESMDEFEFDLYIEKDTFAPVKIEADMKDAMNTLLPQIYLLSGLEIEISVDKTDIVAEYCDFNKDFEIEVPEAALNASETAMYN